MHCDKTQIPTSSNCFNKDGGIGVETGRTVTGIAGGTAGGFAGAAKGAAIGGSFGTVVPLVGNVAGAVVGGVIGGVLGAWGGGRPLQKALLIQ